MTDAGERSERHVWVLLVMCATLCVVMVGRLFFGSATFGWPSATIFEVRLTRLYIGCIVGVALSCSGVGLQALLRNPLAEPFILGLSTGAGVGVMAQKLLERHLEGPIGPSYLGALIGAGASLMVVYVVSRRRGLIDPIWLLLTGVVISTINGAIIMFLNFVPGSAGLREDVAAWMMGFISDDRDQVTIWLVGAVTAVGFVTMLIRSRAMDVATFSDAEAESLGVHLGRLRATLLLTASMLAAGAVVLAGPIAFVGLICPHVARMLLGPGHGPLVIGAALCGAMLVTLADAASMALHLSFNWGLMPLGIFTAILGGIFFLWMLRPRGGALE